MSRPLPALKDVRAGTAVRDVAAVDDALRRAPAAPNARVEAALAELRRIRQFQDAGTGMPIPYVQNAQMTRALVYYARICLKPPGPG